MALIRQTAAHRVTQDAIVLDLGDLSLQGENLRTRARAEADAMIREARAERERLLRDARELGRAQGLAEGREEGRAQGREEGRAAALAERGAELDRVATAWAEAMDRFVAVREQLLVEGRTDVVRLAVLLAERITKRAVAQDPSIAAAQMEGVLAQISRRTRLRLAIHPDDEATVREALPAALARATLIEHCELTVDPSLSRGSCIATTPGGGEIDATIETQLTRISEALLPGPSGPAPVALAATEPAAPEAAS